MYTGYLALSGRDLVNNERASQYASTLGITNVTCGSCPGLANAAWDRPYTSPDQDDAPWWDPVVPDSKDFAGFIGLEVTGISRTSATRDIVALASDGASLHPLRRAHREIQVKALALARTDAALAYGLSWLASALRGNVCNSGCSGDILCFFTSCPPCSTDPSGVCADPYLRSIYNVGLLTMDEPTDVKSFSGGWMATVTYTLAAGNPYIYQDPTLIAIGPTSGTVIPDYDPDISITDCQEDIDCLVTGRPPVSTEWPACPPPPAPILPPLPVDACFPVGTFTARRMIYSLASDQVPVWAEKVPYVVIKTGGRSMERIILRWYGNPTGLDCAQTLDPCAACAEVNIAFIPSGATLVIDGRLERAFLDCAGGPGRDTAEPPLYGPGGSPFVWPVFTCSDSMCLEVVAKDASIADDADIEVSYIVREDAS
jgi:hypothetical protein